MLFFEKAALRGDESSLTFVIRHPSEFCDCVALKTLSKVQKLQETNRPMIKFDFGLRVRSQTVTLALHLYDESLYNPMKQLKSFVYSYLFLELCGLYDNYIIFRHSMVQILSVKQEDYDVD